MSELTKLLEEVKVEWKSLGVLANLITTGRLNANAMEENGMYPFFTCNERPYRINKYAFDLEAILISGNGSKVGHINYYKGKFNAYQRTYVVGELNDEIKMKYLLHYLNFMLKKYIGVHSKKGSVPYITMPMLQSLLIPIPCPDNPEKSLKIQQEIVRILDRLSEETNQLNAALQKELDLHQKRYDFYREELFKFEGKEVEWKSLGEVYKFQYGKGNTIPTNGGEYPVYGSNGIVGSHTDYNSEDAPVIGHIGAYAGIVNWASGKHFVTYNGVICKLITGDVIPRYGYYQLLKQDFNSLSKNSSQPFVSYKELNSVIIPIPTVEIQQEIVRILDSLTEEINQLTKALQKEISLRNKQYEYYRDRLLSFPK